MKGGVKMRKLIVLIGVLLLLLGPAASAAPAGIAGPADAPKTTVVVFLNPYIQQSQKAFNIFRDGLREKFAKADIIYLNDGKAKSPAFLEFMEKVQTDPVNDKGIILVREEHLRKLGQDTVSRFVVLVNFRITGYNGYGNFWSKLIVSAYDVDAAKPVAFDTWYKGELRWPSEGTEHYIKTLRSEFVWPVAELEAAKGEVVRPAVVLFLPDTILEMPELVKKMRDAVAGKFRVGSVPIYLDSTPKTADFLILANKVAVDSAQQNTFIVRKEYLAEYGKQTNSKPVIAVKLHYTEYDYSIWASKPVYRFQQDILVVDPETNQYIASTTFDTGEKMGRSEGVDFLLDKLRNDFIWRP